MVEIQISGDLVHYEDRTKGSLRFIGHVESWLSDHQVSYTLRAEYFDRKLVKWFVRFDKESDAVLFKLTWIGA